jgi:C-terminal processing protease CtpA/Prc
VLRRAPLLLCLFPTIVFASGPDKEGLIKAIGKTLQSEAYAPGVDFQRWPKVVQRHRARLTQAKTDDEIAATLTLALTSLGASHVNVLTPAYMKAPFEMKGSGMFTVSNQDTEEIVVWKVFPGGPAEKAGVHPGDLVLEHKNLFSGLDGTPAKPVWMKVQRGKKELEFRIEPAEHDIFDQERLDWIDTSTAVLTISTFTPHYNAKRVEKLVEEAALAERLVLDLRFNPGGKPWNVEHLLGFFLPKQTFFGSFVSRQESTAFRKSHPKGSLAQLAASVPYKMRTRQAAKPFKGQVVVLVNEFSGSAAEVAAQALQDWGHTVFGRKTAGAVLMSDSKTMPGGFELVFPRFDYISARGRRLERNAVRPDVPVETVDVGWAGNPDTALRQIAKYLEKGARTPSSRENNRTARA